MSAALPADDCNITHPAQGIVKKKLRAEKNFRGAGKAEKQKKNCAGVDPAQLMERCHPDSNWGIKVLQTFALPLGHGTIRPEILTIIRRENPPNEEER